ncbi:IclR family transcriptional regulator [Anaerocellum diazotrophicum]|uniref:IclR family transcriptional regulator n=1 Tax=Caldicellulosiruptor diazotrophicus TaxID=2806205 RepID=A0ABM7NJA9_9FIRM|nr:IclR family transcriptional regulator [Caldicellulosiruptor diazotrophicus]BCS80179.1 IclR family transcriptional regulator [Caldicellulosiruptor diazotrophicus]
MEKEKNLHRSLQRALDIMELIASCSEGLTLSNISQKLGIPKSSALSLLNTLVERKYLIFDSATNRYKMGIKMFEVGSGYLRESEFMDAIMAVVAKVARKSNETVHLAVRDGRDVIYIAKIESNHPIRIASSIGKRIPAHATALGKALLSGLSDKELRELYSQQPPERLTANTICEVEKLIEEIRKVRENGYALDYEESSEGVRCFGAPIFNHNEQIIAAISIAVPTIRVNEENEGYFIELIKEAAQEISDILKIYQKQSLI